MNIAPAAATYDAPFASAYDPQQGRQASATACAAAPGKNYRVDASDARPASPFDDELGPWVAMPDGGLEWRG